VVGLAAVATVQTRARARLADANGQLRASLARESAATAATARALAQAREEADKAQAVNDFLTRDLLTQAEPENNAVEDHVTLREVLDRAAAKVGGRFAGTPEVEEGVRRTIARTYHGLGSWAESERQTRAVLDSARRRLGPDAAEALVEQGYLGHILDHRGRFPEALALLEPAAAGLARAVGPDHPDTLQSRNNLALAYLAAGRTAEAIRLLEAVVKTRETALGPDHPETLTSRANLAYAYAAAGRTAEAIRLLEAVLKARESKSGPDHPHTLTTRANLAHAYWRAGRLDRSVPIFEEAYRQQRAKLGPDHPHTLATLANLGVNLRDAGRPAEGARLLQEALDRARGRPDTQAMVAFFRPQLALAYDAAGQPDRAEPLHRDALEQSRRQFGPADPRTAGAMAQLGYVLLQQEKWSEAEPVLRECLAVREKTQPGAWSTFNTRSQLGGALLGQGRYAEAEPLVVPGYEGLKARAATIPPASRPRLTEAALRVVRLYESWGKPDQAAAWKSKLGLADLPADVFAR
jgi:tetratricopeptide (TPR) repeat protein